MRKTCTKCKRDLSVDLFSLLTRNYGKAKAGDRARECKSCAEKGKSRRSAATKEQTQEPRGIAKLPTFSLDALLAKMSEIAIARRDKAESIESEKLKWDLEGAVDITEVRNGGMHENSEASRKAIADALSGMVWKATEHRYV